MGDPRCCLDDHLEADPFGAPRCGLAGGDKGVDGVDIGGRSDLWDHDLVQPWPGLFQKVHHIAVPVGRIKAVDPNAKGLAAPIHLGNRLDDVHPRLRFVGRGHRIFQIKVDHIRRRGRHLGKKLRPGAWGEQLAAVWAGRGRGLHAKAHWTDPSLGKACRQVKRCHKGRNSAFALQELGHRAGRRCMKISGNRAL